jgi:cyclohexyl-isocyanide hydratase
VAEAIQLGIEYAPAPPFNAGSPDTAPPKVLQAVRARMAGVQTDRLAVVQRIATTLRQEATV